MHQNTYKQNSQKIKIINNLKQIPMKKLFYFSVLILIVSCSKDSSNGNSSCDWTESTLIGKNYRLSKIDSLNVFCNECNADSVYGKYATTLSFKSNNELVVNKGFWHWKWEQILHFSQSDNKYYLTKTASTNSIKLIDNFNFSESFDISDFSCSSFSYYVTILEGRKIDSTFVVNGPNGQGFYAYKYNPVKTKVTFTNF